MSDILHFSHANGFPGGSYRVLLEHLQPHYDVRWMDRIGHHAQFPVTDGWGMLSQELERYFEQHYSQPVIAVGHSLGGALSLMLANRRPDLIKAVVMLDVPALTPLQGIGLRAMKLLGMVDRVTPAARTEGRRQCWQSQEEALDYFRGKYLMRHFDERCLKDYVHHGTEDFEGGVQLRFDPAIEMSIYRTLPHRVFRRKMPVPTALIAGQDSNVVRAANTRYMTQRLGIDVQWSEGSHMFPFEYPEQTAARIHKLVTQLLA